MCLTNVILALTIWLYLGFSLIDSTTGRCELEEDARTCGIAG